MAAGGAHPLHHQLVVPIITCCRTLAKWNCSYKEVPWRCTLFPDAPCVTAAMLEAKLEGDGVSVEAAVAA